MTKQDERGKGQVAALLSLLARQRRTLWCKRSFHSPMCVAVYGSGFNVLNFLTKAHVGGFSRWMVSALGLWEEPASLVPAQAPALSFWISAPLPSLKTSSYLPMDCHSQEMGGIAAKCTSSFSRALPNWKGAGPMCYRNVLGSAARTVGDVIATGQLSVPFMFSGHLPSAEYLMPRYGGPSVVPDQAALCQTVFPLFSHSSPSGGSVAITTWL